MAADNRLLAQYVKEPVIKERNYVGLNNWAGAEVIQPVPPSPDTAWIKKRIVAERYPQQPENYVQRTLSYFLQDQATQTNIRDYLSAWNTEAEEVALSAQIDSVILAFMPRFADIDVTQQQVDEWLAQHGTPTR